MLKIRIPSKVYGRVAGRRESTSGDNARSNSLCVCNTQQGMQDGHEILLGHRVPELVSFPDYWAFPGGGICEEDRHSAEVLRGKLGVEGKYELACFALLREMVEEVGLSPDGKGNIVQVAPEVRELVCGDKGEWLKLVQDGSIKIEMFQSQMVTDRTTPPFSPRRFQNYFFHVPMGKSLVSPSFPPGRSEFDDFRWWSPDVLIEKWERNQIRIPPPIVTLIRDLANGISNSGDLLRTCDNLSSDPLLGTTGLSSHQVSKPFR